MMARWHESIFPVCEELNVAFVAFSPMSNGFLTGNYVPGVKFETGTDYRSAMPQYTEEGYERSRELLENADIQAMAQKYSKNAGQIILRFEVQEGIVVLPKSTNPVRMAGNIDIFDFELTVEEMNTIRALDTGKGSHNPDAPGVGEMLLSAYKVHD